MESNNNHILLNRKEAAEILGISVNSFDKYFRSNPALKSLKIGSETRYPYPLLMEFISNQADYHY
ncbi:helix-turn-helix domain-containing protein [Weissella cibaria]|uniref:helix-turn-helix domain-containing protein n=1 Tax=Weissella cibaria TaxID=137591 RepID=UPI00106E7E90|nr:helix-turn-helix domain-containing protein [Weissella cibaria]MCQ9619252.1 helix-turn-helix domain-containing protein [Weissella cibaria]